MGKPPCVKKLSPLGGPFKGVVEPQPLVKNCPLLLCAPQKKLFAQWPQKNCGP